MSQLVNTTLAGHKLLILTRCDPDHAILSKLNAQFPDLEINWQNDGFGLPGMETYQVIPEEWYKDATIICTFHRLPKCKGNAPRLQLVQLVSSGVDYCRRSPVYADPDVTFCTGNGAHAPQIVEWIFGTYFSFSHRISRYIDQQRVGEWKPAAASDTDVEDLVRQRIGILGYGAIGRQCARAAKAFGMDVIVYTLRERTTPQSRKDDSYVSPGTGDPDGVIPTQWFHGKTKESLNHFLSQGIDLLVLCLPYTPLTDRMLSREQFKILASKKKAFISNIGRGQLINQDDLIEALTNGDLKGAALDVTDPEPLPKDHPLWKAPNCFISPHVSWHSTARAERVMDILQINLARFSRGEQLINIVDKNLGF